MPTKIQRPGVAEALTRAFGIVGRMRPALDEVIVPTVSIGDLSRGGPPPAARQSVSSFTAAAVPTEKLFWRLDVPPNMIAVIEAITLHATGACNLKVNFPGNAAILPAGPNAANESLTDGRVAGQFAGPGCALTWGSGPGGLGTAWSYQQYLGPASDPPVVIRPHPAWVVGSDEGNYQFLEMALDTINVGLDALAIEWVEYGVP